MAKLNLIDLDGGSHGELTVSDDVFGAEVKEHLLWEVVRSQRAAKRAPTAHTKTRAEVSVTKAKTYRQKGTGNARHGSRRANVFRGGGVVHGPRNAVNHNVRVNRKAIAGALRSALSLRAGSGNLLVITDFMADGGTKASTKTLAAALVKLGSPNVLLVDEPSNDWLRLSARNLERANFLSSTGVNVYDVLRHPRLLISEKSVRVLESRLAKASKPSEDTASVDG